MQPAYYEDFREIKKKIWSMLSNAVKDRNCSFRIPVFICGNQSDFDGRIVVLRKSDEAKNNGSLLPITELVDKFYGDVQGMGGNRWDTSSLIKRFRK